MLAIRIRVSSLSAVTHPLAAMMGSMYACSVAFALADAPRRASQSERPGECVARPVAAPAQQPGAVGS